MEELIITALLADGTVTALTSTRIYWTAAPQGVAAPYVVLTVISDFSEYTTGGFTDLTQGRIQADCYATTFGAAKAIARVMIPAMNNLCVAGTAASGVRGAFHDATRDTREGGSNEADRLFRCSLDFMVSYRS